jgi:predicted  nucleic acid-binding Zn-ribbon protein
MGKESLKLGLVSLERKIKILLEEKKKLKDEINLLKAEKERFSEQLKNKEEMISDFQNQIKISKIVNNIGEGSEETENLRSKIDEYIQEIDKCIVQLSE